MKVGWGSNLCYGSICSSYAVPPDTIGRLYLVQLVCWGLHSPGPYMRGDVCACVRVCVCVCVCVRVWGCVCTSTMCLYICVCLCVYECTSQGINSWRDCYQAVSMCSSSAGKEIESCASAVWDVKINVQAAWIQIFESRLEKYTYYQDLQMFCWNSQSLLCASTMQNLPPN